MDVTGTAALENRTVAVVSRNDCELALIITLVNGLKIGYIGKIETPVENRFQAWFSRRPRATHGS
jgi:hypothetical protein